MATLRLEPCLVWSSIALLVCDAQLGRTSIPGDVLSTLAHWIIHPLHDALQRTRDILFWMELVWLVQVL
eukprot:5333165-Amphidinium_carterae.1